MTYERPEILKNTIKKIQDQSFPPEFILIVDNSESTQTKLLIEDLDDPKIGYYRVGYNSGPAGASKIGLSKLTELGFEWIYWGDDDNPPKNNTFFEHLFQKITNCDLKNPLGILGGRGGNLNKLTGRIRSLTNKQLEYSSLVEVDYVPGGHTMLVSSKVVKNGVLPDEKLFFGFEELDFCLRVQENGFSVVTDTEEWIKDHQAAGNIAPNYRWRGSTFGNPNALWRSYYSTRNLLYLFRNKKMVLPFSLLFFKSIFKSFAGYRHGVSYGKQNFKLQWQAIFDFLKGELGKAKL